MTWDLHEDMVQEVKSFCEKHGTPFLIAFAMPGDVGGVCRSWCEDFGHEDAAVGMAECLDLHFVDPDTPDAP